MSAVNMDGDESVRYLLIVRRNRPELHGYLSRMVSRHGDVQVIVDRRQGGGGDEPGQRRGDRRHQPSIAEAPDHHGFVITRPD